LNNLDVSAAFVCSYIPISGHSFIYYQHLKDSWPSLVSDCLDMVTDLEVTALWAKMGVGLTALSICSIVRGDVVFRDHGIG
jgi:hypothetical protein